MFNKKLYIIVLSFSAALFTLQFQNCSKFGVDQNAKHELISSVKVFENSSEFPTGNEEFDQGYSWSDETFDGGGGMNNGPGSGPNQSDGGMNPNSNYNPGGNVMDLNLNAPGMIPGMPSSPIRQIVGNENLIQFPVGLDQMGSNNDPVTQNIMQNGVKVGTEYLSLPVNLICSDMTITGTRKSSSKILRTPLVLASSLDFIVTDLNENVLCHINNSEALRNEIIATGSISLNRCGQIPAPFLVSLFADGDRSNKLLAKVRDHFAGDFNKPRKVRAADAKQGIDLLYNENVKKSVISLSPMADNQFMSYCDAHDSPLFIDFRSQEEQELGYELTSPKDGILFDIQGDNARPSPNTPKRISWFKDERMAFIALPDRFGRVLGIDQLFGDNTHGPDGKYAANGFTALAKFDGLSYTTDMEPRELAHHYHRIRRVPDGKIDSNDDVYQKLRLWKDLNGDGIAEPEELLSLEEAGVELIDLVYDKHFKEKDEHGNIVKYKSVVKLSSGAYRLVFDIWFRVDSGN